MDYKPNSHKYKAEQKAAENNSKNLEKIVTGSVQVKKKSAFRKLMDLFISEDIEDLEGYIIREVIIPGAKQLLLDSIETVFNGRTSSRRGRPSGPKVSYDGYYNNNSRDYDRPRPKPGHEFENLVFDRKRDAEDVLFKMDELINEFHIAGISDLYELVGITPRTTDYSYGWTDIQSATIIRGHDGRWLLKLPRPLPIN